MSPAGRASRWTKMEPMSDDLTGLGPRGFERMCQALGTYALGPGIEAFGSGPDGGREATVRGLVPFPSDAERWNGYGVLQAKFKERILGTGADTSWLRTYFKITEPLACH